MKLTKTISIYFVLLIVLGSAQAMAAEEITKAAGTIDAADEQMLNVDGQEVLSLYRHGERARLDGGVILLHDQGANPDWPGVVRTLRRELPRYGWSTLAVALPAPDNSAKSSAQVLKAWSQSVPKRIEAAIVAMGERNIFNLVLIGHGTGAAIAADYIAKNPSDRIQGLIAIGMDGSRHEDEALDGAMILRKVNRRIFDLYGSRDLEPVVNSAQRRERVAVSAEPGKQRQHLRAADFGKGFNQQNALQITYRQHRLEGADHHFHGYERQLLSRVAGWLRRYIGSSSIKIKRAK
ncbi:MAG: alpha/beta hydrolase family protein [Gammaproteobacteria bacterium]|nr:alpha/beta hydrolase family protein [Gammaproteobacteria bacterium]